jgi:hypothetical protein
MSKFKHTPGPWKVEIQQYPEGSHICVADNAGDWVADCGKMSTLPSNNKEATANAKLISAAPDLLEALIDAADELEVYDASSHGQDEDTRRVLGLVRKAIKKATK